MKKLNLIGMLCCCFWTAATLASGARGPALVPLPQKMQLRAGTFTLTPDTSVVVDFASRETGNYLAERLRQSTGFPLNTDTNSLSGSVTRHNILLTTKNADANLGPEGYELTVTPDSVVIRGPTQAGLFYGAQTFLQLLPPEIFCTNLVTNVDWQTPCVQIEDWPQFKWRGLMLDVARHFYSKEDVERLLDAMAMQKLNVFHWHLTDDHGWRIEIKKYPRLTQIGAWRAGVGFGLDPSSTTAYAADGRYGGFYTQADIREVVKYAAARHICIVPEIEMPGHSLAALAAYPQFSCTGGPFAIPSQLGIFNGIYNPAQAKTFAFLDDVLAEVFQLFPGKYVHLGGDEVPKDTWRESPACQALMQREGLTNEDELQGWFMRRMETFAETHGRIPVGWSEILEGGLAKNTVVMDWIGGATQAASQGHEVVMAANKSCYLCYYPSLDRPPDLRAYRSFLPLRQVYAFEPVPATLAARYRTNILGAEACVWTPDIPSLSEVEKLTFPRLCALAEVVWTPQSARHFEDFSCRLPVEQRRLALSGVNYWRDSAVEIGRWKPSQLVGENNQLAWDATREITSPGRYRLSLDYTRGKNGLNIKWVALLENGHEIARDAHAGFTGTNSRREMARAWNYFVALPSVNRDARYTIQAAVAGAEGRDSSGVVFLDRDWPGT